MMSNYRGKKDETPNPKHLNLPLKLSLLATGSWAGINARRAE